MGSDEIGEKRGCYRIVTQRAAPGNLRPRDRGITTPTIVILPADKLFYFTGPNRLGEAHAI